MTFHAVPAFACNTANNGYDYTLLVWFSSTNGLAHSTTAIMHVGTSSSFSITVDPLNPSVSPGTVVTYTMTVLGTGTFSGAVSITTPVLPPCGYVVSAPSTRS